MVYCLHIDLLQALMLDSRGVKLDLCNTSQGFLISPSHHHTVPDSPLTVSQGLEKRKNEHHDVTMMYI